MTTVPATNLQGIPYPVVDSAAIGMPEAQDARSFADTLLEMIGREFASAKDEQHPFGGGTMRPTVEIFDARGFFDGSVPMSAGSTAPGGVTMIPAAAVSSTGDPAIDPAGCPPAISSSAVMASQAPRPIADGRRPDIGMDDVPSPRSFPSAMQVDANALAAVAEPASEPPLQVAYPPAPPRRAGPAGDIVDTTPPARPFARRVTNERCASTLKVALDIGEAGVAVSVIGDHLGTGEETALHHGVAHLLARHGLVLSELRVMRRPSADGQQQGSR